MLFIGGFPSDLVPVIRRGIYPDSRSDETTASVSSVTTCLVP